MTPPASRALVPPTPYHLRHATLPRPRPALCPSLVLLALLLAAPTTAQPAADSASPPAPESAQSLAASARSALDRGDTAGALSLATAAVERSPSDPAAYALRAAVHDARRDWGQSVADYTTVLSLAPDHLHALHRRGEAYFRLGGFKQSVADFDKELALVPDRAPHHWQRGISLYYAGDYPRGAAQFELHRTVNPDDVENAAWHYLCVARDQGVQAARRALIHIAPGADRRVPMTQIHALYAGKLQPEDVLAAATAGDPPAAERRRRLMYAHLYLGLHHEAAGDAAQARQHITLAAEKYALEDDYMSDVARAHAATLTPAALLRDPADFPRLLNRRVHATGVARHHPKGGATITLNDQPLYIDGLEKWPADLVNKQVRVTGILTRIPDPPPGHAGIVDGHKLIDARWDLAE